MIPKHVAITKAGLLDSSFLVATPDGMNKFASAVMVPYVKCLFATKMMAYWMKLMVSSIWLRMNRASGSS